MLASGKVQVLSNRLNGVNLVWYTLLMGLAKTRFIFDTWWDVNNQKDALIGVNGSTSEYSWYGGFAFLESVATTARYLSMGGMQIPASFSTSGMYGVGDVLTLVGGIGGQVTVTAVLAGVPQSVKLSQLGSGYIVGTSVATTGGSGSGMTIDWYGYAIHSP